MEIKVRALDGIEEKSVQQVEEELLKKHEEELNNGVIDEVKIDTSHLEPQVPEVQEEEELSEEKVLSYIGKRYNKQINSFDELMDQRQSNEQLPEDVAAYLQFKKDTGRGFDDFIKLIETTALWILINFLENILQVHKMVLMMKTLMFSWRSTPTMRIWMKSQELRK